MTAEPRSELQSKANSACSKSPASRRDGASGRRDSVPSFVTQSYDDPSAGAGTSGVYEGPARRQVKEEESNTFLDSLLMKNNVFKRIFHRSMSTSNIFAESSPVKTMASSSSPLQATLSVRTKTRPKLKNTQSNSNSKSCENLLEKWDAPSKTLKNEEQELDQPNESSMRKRFAMRDLAQGGLLAANLFHIIPTERARGRNYLNGRIASTSLLGALELERVLPDRYINVFVATWNMNGLAPPLELNDLLLPAEIHHVPDLLVVATQESYPERFQWEVKLQETLGPSHVLFHSAVHGTLHLAIMMKRDLVWFCSVPEEASATARAAAAFRTKGAIAIGFMLFGTSMLFICSHLTAHAEKVKERVNDARRIISSLELPKSLPLKHVSKDATQNYDCVIWCGDLNFRLDCEREEVINWATCQQTFPADCPINLDGDQLKQVMSEGKAFSEFQEGSITFPPTYKFDPGTNNFDTSSKRRTPAYTDRILYKSRNSNDLRCQNYSSVPAVMTSDHKPVWGLYEMKIRPGKDTIPLAAGLFNREVYLEAMKRRAKAINRQHGMSVVCSVQ